ncbi:dihydroorotate dehydrogenase (quinone) [Halomonas elongata]|uniref:Dihydroorotate dehydrogenase (Quinone) n=1 Tax=Halomonas elongata TaxID=2746 RepID=A0A1B8P0Q9_HALEL|nr:dihydroorotate dehydrogenase (quinone) [Halomonas elongata]
MYSLARSLLFRLDAEKAHGVALSALDMAQRLGLAAHLGKGGVEDPVTLMGLRFPNRVGLAAGLDKNADHLDALGALGFGFVEVGTVTPKPQDGNPGRGCFACPRPGRSSIAWASTTPAWITWSSGCGARVTLASSVSISART